MEVYCRSTGLLRTCTWYHGKRGGCVGDVSTLVGLRPTHQPPSLADPHSSFFKQLVQVMIEQLNQLISD
ncbi:hypothetical protein MUO79_02430 [Candidatus Bathyarchaeota archaeon]|nr:hypothetical protein [Candidatus Bathyarchaeota archaeon]